MLLTGSALFINSCTLVGLDAQKSYDYKRTTLDPNVGISAKQFIERQANGTTTNPADTAFRWMLKGLQYSGIDLAEYEKLGKTFILLHNDAIRVRNNTTNAVTGGLFFTYGIVQLNPDGSPKINPSTGAFVTVPATKWEDYKKETVRKYFLYLIGQGVYNFDNLALDNTIIQSELPAGSVPPADEKTLFKYNGFDKDGKFTLKFQNVDAQPLVFNDANNARSSGHIATNGTLHVFNSVVHPFRPVAP